MRSINQKISDSYMGFKFEIKKVLNSTYCKTYNKDRVKPKISQGMKAKDIVGVWTSGL